MTKEQLLQLRSIKPPFEERVNIDDIKADSDMPVELRMEEYLKQIKNPYFFKCGEIAVNVEFSSDGGTLEDALFSYLTALKRSQPH